MFTRTLAVVVGAGLCTAVLASFGSCSSGENDIKDVSFNDAATDGGNDGGAVPEDGGCPGVWAPCPIPAEFAVGTLCDKSDLYRVTCDQPPGCKRIVKTLELYEACQLGCSDPGDGKASCLQKAACKTGAVGEVLFKFKALSAVYGSMAFDAQGNAYFGDKNGRIYSVDCAGRQRWIWISKSSYFNRPFVIGSDGTVYAAGEYLFAFDGRGVEKWTVSGDGAMNSAPVLAGGGVVYTGYVTTDGEPKDITGGLLAVNSDGIAVDGFPIRIGGVFSSPALGASMLFLPSVDYVHRNTVSTLRAVNAFGGIGWTTDLDAFGSSVALGADGNVYLAENSKDMDIPAVLDAFDPDNGYKRWSFDFLGSFTKGVVGSPLVASAASGEDVIVLTRDGHLASVNSLAGAAKLVFNIELTASERSGAGSPLLGDDGYIYAAVAESLTQTKLFKVSPDGKSKTELAAIDGVRISTALSIRGDGAIYFGSESGDVVAVKVEAGGLNKGAPWPSFRHDMRNTGDLGAK